MHIGSGFDNGETWHRGLFGAVDQVHALLVGK